MGLPQSSFDNSSAYTESRKYGRPKVQLTQRDFRIPGLAVTVVAVVLLLFLGFGTCVFNYGLPPPIVVSEVSETPEKLKPKVVTENRPKEAKQVSYNKLMVNWKTFLEKPDEKAFAVGELKEGLKTRPWAASWNHETQDEANKAALEECERLADKCRLIYPSKEEGVGKGAEDLRKMKDEAVKEKQKKDKQMIEAQQQPPDEEGASFLRRSTNFLTRHQQSMMRDRRLWRTAALGGKELHPDAMRVNASRSSVTCGHATIHACA
jgi:hypothetical protein